MPDASILRSLFDEALKQIADEKAANQESERRKEQREIEDLAAQKGMALWAFAMAAFTAIQVVVGCVTLFYLYRTFQENRRTADSAVGAAIAAEQSAAAFKYSERAWLSAKGIDLATVMNDHVAAYFFIVRWINAGKTPALNLRTWFGWRVLSPDEVFPPFLKQGDGPHAPPVGPGVEFSVGNSLTAIEVELLRDVAKGQKKLILWCRVEYEDIFHAGTVRHSEMCKEITIFTFPEAIGDPKTRIVFGDPAYGDQNGAS